MQHENPFITIMVDLKISYRDNFVDTLKSVVTI